MFLQLVFCFFSLSGELVDYVCLPFSVTLVFCHSLLFSRMPIYCIFRFLFQTTSFLSFFFISELWFTMLFWFCVTLVYCHYLLFVETPSLLSFLFQTTSFFSFFLNASLLYFHFFSEQLVYCCCLSCSLVYYVFLLLW